MKRYEKFLENEGTNLDSQIAIKKLKKVYKIRKAKEVYWAWRENYVRTLKKL